MKGFTPYLVSSEEMRFYLFYAYSYFHSLQDFLPSLPEHTSYNHRAKRRIRLMEEFKDPGLINAWMTSIHSGSKFGFEFQEMTFERVPSLTILMQL